MKSTIKKLGKRPTAEVTADRRLRELKYAKKYGWWNFSNQEWARKEQVSPKAIDADKAFLKKHYSLDVIDTEEIKFELHNGLKELLIKARKKALETDWENESNQIRWAQTYGKLSEQFTKFLEDFGAKERVADKLSVEDGTFNARDIRAIYKEYEEKVK